MDAQFLPYLRCPLDPRRAATLKRDDQSMVCNRCSVTFPLKQGIPILDAAEGELPQPLRELSQLPCRKSADRRRS